MVHFDFLRSYDNAKGPFQNNIHLQVITDINRISTFFTSRPQGDLAIRRNRRIFFRYQVLQIGGKSHVKPGTVWQVFHL